jgi:hypothetical protein
LVQILSSASCSETFSVYILLSVRDQVSHPWKSKSMELSPWEAVHVFSYCYISPKTAYVDSYITTWFLHISFTWELCKGRDKNSSLCLTKEAECHETVERSRGSAPTFLTSAMKANT